MDLIDYDTLVVLGFGVSFVVLILGSFYYFVIAPLFIPPAADPNGTRGTPNHLRYKSLIPTPSCMLLS